MTKQHGGRWLLTVAVLAFGVMAAGRGVAGVAPIAKYGIADVAQGKGWGPVSLEGGHKFRPALSNMTATIHIPVWWGSADRPPEGRRYSVDVTYRDTVSNPVVCEGFGALGRYFSSTELHRFGGEGDGQWKVASIPVSWDLIRVPKGKRVAELSFIANAGLPIESVTVRDAVLPEDQVRWEAETRQWIVRSQSRRKLEEFPVKPSDAASLAWAAEGAKFYLEEIPEIPSDWIGKPGVPYVRRYFDNISTFGAPKSSEVNVPVTVRLARNEIEPGTFGIFAQDDLKQVHYTVSDLTGPAGKLNCEVRCLTMEYSMGWGGGKFWRAPIRWWSEFPVDVKKGRSQWFCVNVKTLGAASLPGQYRGTITVTCNGTKVMLPLQVEVLPITLLTMDEAGLRMGGCVSGFPTFGELQTMMEYNHNMVNLWVSGACPEMSYKNGKLALDFTYLDDWMTHARAAGIKTIVWFLGGNPNGYPRTITLERELYTLTGQGKNAYVERMSKPDQRGKMLPEVKDLYTQWLTQVVAHAKEKQWPELVLAPFDEPAKWVSAPKPENPKTDIGCGVWIRDHFKATCKLIHETVPGTKVYISMHHNNTRPPVKGRVGEIYLPDVDINCSNAIHEDPELGNKTRAAGKEFWQYTSSRGRRYSFGFYFGAYDSRGSLAWAYNFNGHFSPPCDTYGSYSPFTTVTTPTFEEIREGWDDRRYMETLKVLAQAKGVDESGFFKHLRDLTLKGIGAGGRDTVNAFWESSKDPVMMDGWRNLLIDEILKLNGLAGSPKGGKP